MTDGIEFIDPPETRGGHRRASEFDDIAAALRQRPNQWAKIARKAYPQWASKITSGQLAAFRPRGSFQGTTRKNGEGWDVYARYVGGAS